MNAMFDRDDKIITGNQLAAEIADKLGFKKVRSLQLHASTGEGLILKIEKFVTEHEANVIRQVIGTYQLNCEKTEAKQE